MKAFLIFLILSLTVKSITAQDFQGEIHYYKSMHDTKLEAVLNDPSASLDKKREAEKNLQIKKDVLEGSYTLTFNKYESVYKWDKKLLVQDNGYPILPEDDYYKNFKEGIYITKRDVSGHIFYVSEKLPSFDWKLSDETKMIGKYTCHKAIYSYEGDLVEMIKNEDGGFEQKKSKKIYMTTAWYTPQIPIMNGPSQYGGLPGLILEVSNDYYEFTIKCTEISIDSKKEVTVKKPNSKKLLTEKEFKTEMTRLITGGRN